MKGERFFHQWMEGHFTSINALELPLTADDLLFDEGRSGKIVKHLRPLFFPYLFGPAFVRHLFCIDNNLSNPISGRSNVVRTCCGAAAKKCRVNVSLHPSLNE